MHVQPLNGMQRQWRIGFARCVTVGEITGRIASQTDDKLLLILLILWGGEKF
jgi:hypothetical protein